MEGQKKINPLLNVIDWTPYNSFKTDLKMMNLSFKPLSAPGVRISSTVVSLVLFVVLCCCLMPGFRHESVCLHPLCDQKCLQPTTEAKIIL